MASHNELGILGEQLALDYLVKKGFLIREKNWRFQKAEVDIIAQKEGILAVVEVKTRSTNFFGEPQDFVRDRKIKLLTKAIDHYVQTKDLDVEVRFDVIGIVKKDLQTSIIHLEDAFYHF
jgi:putative endonuclease